MPPKPPSSPTPRQRRQTGNRRADDRQATVTTVPPSGGMTVEDLAERTGVSVRNIRAYQTAGLMPPPKLQGRNGFYNQGHLGKLELIRDLRQQGFKLDAIKRMLDRTPQGAWTEYSLISELFSTTFFTVEAPQRRALKEMAAHWDTTATPEQKERLARSGMYRAVGDEEVELLSPALERIGIQLSELQVPLDTVLDLQDTLIKHTRAIAKAYVEHLFLAMAEALTSAQRASQGPGSGAHGDGNAASPTGAVPSPDKGEHFQIDPMITAQLKVLFERLRPLAIGSISAAFPVVLQQEFDRSLQKQSRRSS